MSRVFLAPSIFMQRIAWLRAAAFHGSSRIRSQQELASTLYRVASAPMIPSPADLETLAEYVKIRQAEQRFGETIPAQDLWLCRSEISWNGSLTRESANEVPSWAVSYGICKAQTLTPTVVGRRLVAARSLAEDGDWSKATRNPFVLDPAEKFVALGIVLDADGDLLPEWLQRLPPNHAFDRIEAGNLLEPALAILSHQAEGREAIELERLRAAIARQVDGETRRGVREHWATPRLEQLADVGLLEKSARARFSFRFSKSGLRVRDAISHASSALDVARLAWAPNSKEATLQEARTSLVAAYRRSRSHLGLAEIDDMWVLANAELLFSTSPSWISRSSLDFQINEWLTSGRASFNVDKLGRIKYVKLTRELVDSTTAG